MSYIKKFENHNFNKEKYYNIINGMIIAHKDPSISDIKYLDDIFRYKEFYNKTKKWLEDKFNLLKKYSYDDIEDRLLEFFLEIMKFDPFVEYALCNKYSSHIINHKKLNDHTYFINILSEIINDIHYEYYINHISIDEYFINKKPAIYIQLNRHTSNREQRSKYNLIYLENLEDRIIKRFKYLFDIDVDAESHKDREERKYDPNIDVDRYTIKLYLK